MIFFADHREGWMQSFVNGYPLQASQLRVIHELARFKQICIAKDHGRFGGSCNAIILDLWVSIHMRLAEGKPHIIAKLASTLSIVFRIKMVYLSASLFTHMERHGLKKQNVFLN
jgi:hypothetical protein